MEDLYRLQRFVDVQDKYGVYDQAVSEVQAGRKVSHWMWYIFPQVAGLGYSDMSRKFAISSLAEARAYLKHPILGPRLTACAQALLQIRNRSATEIFGTVDAMKLRSSMTLFMTAAEGEDVFQQVLDKYFNGSPDEATITRL